MMNSVAPVWDGNETWLVLGGGGLLRGLSARLCGDHAGALCADHRHAAGARLPRRRLRIPLAHAARQVPVGLGLLRRLADRRTSRKGIALGAFVQGIPVDDRAYAGGWWDWLTPFSLFTGVALVAGYALLGATWLILKTDGALQDEVLSLRLAAWSGTLVLIGLVSLWTPFLEPLYMERWFTWPQHALHGAGAAPGCGRCLCPHPGHIGRRELTPFLAALALFVLSYVGLGISFYPYIVPPTLTIWDAAGTR